MTYRTLTEMLLPLYGEREARAIVRLLYSSLADLSLTDLCMGADTHLPEEKQAAIDAASRRLLAGEPVQYVIGRAVFAGNEFAVAPGVLIPRPETEELCQWIVGQSASSASIVDIGTGTGCIAVTLSQAMPDAYVEGWDVSEEALAVARKNLHLHHSGVVLRRRDILTHRPSGEKWDVIVSNPPYIPEHERDEMDKNVVCFEPASALFVPDDDPLKFYRSISSYAISTLKEGGQLFFETHHRFNSSVAEMLTGMGFDEVECRNDVFGKPRMVRARKTTAQLARRYDNSQQNTVH